MPVFVVTLYCVQCQREILKFVTAVSHGGHQCTIAHLGAPAALLHQNSGGHVVTFSSFIFFDVFSYEVLLYEKQLSFKF